MKNLYFLVVAFCSTFFFAQSDVTFSVDMSGESGFTQMYLTGSFDEWAGNTIPMTDMGSGIWEATVPLEDGEYEYKFTYDEWAGQEALVQGDVCTITNYGNTNRYLRVDGEAMTLPTAIWNECNDVGGPFNVTFRVDVTPYEGEFSTVYIAGENYNDQGLGNWVGDANPMTDLGDGVWEITLPLEAHAYMFKFEVDNWAADELFSPGDPQTSTDGTYTNRYIQVDGSKTVEYVWAVPEATTDLGTHNVEMRNELQVYPNPTNSDWIIKSNEIVKSVVVYNMAGKRVMTLQPNAADFTLHADKLSKGVYVAQVESETGTSTIKLMKK